MADRISEQTILEKAYIPETKTLAVTGHGFDGTNAQAIPAQSVAKKKKIVTSGTTTTIYFGIAAPGTALATNKWQCSKTVIDSSVTDVVDIQVTWADGDVEFNNVATDLTALTYS